MTYYSNLVVGIGYDVWRDGDILERIVLVIRVLVVSQWYLHVWILIDFII